MSISTGLFYKTNKNLIFTFEPNFATMLVSANPKNNPVKTRYYNYGINLNVNYIFKRKEQMKALSKILLALSLLANIAKAQVVLPLGLGQKSSLNITCSYNDKLWVLSEEQNNFVVRKWDGSFWIPMADIPSSVLDQLSSDHSKSLLIQFIILRMSYSLPYLTNHQANC
jgi:hypothetical protein